MRKRASALPVRASAAIGLCLLASAAAAEAGGMSLSGALGSVEDQLHTEESRLEEQRVRRKQAHEALQASGPQGRVARERLKRDARALYRLSRGGMLPVAGGMAAMLGHAARVSRLERLVTRDLHVLRDNAARASRLRGELTTLDAQIAETERQLSALQVARVGVVRERALSHGLEAALNRLPSQPVRSARPQYGLTVLSGGGPAERFVDQRGNLALPVSGPTSVQEASRAESDGPGLELVGHEGAAVRAGASGSVVFAEPYASYGTLVILDHGERYYTVYGGLERLEVQVGDSVSKSARLGTLGSAPLYFEVRRGSKAQDARSWLGL
jgi:murein DD-endopeptidase MepM/ murein hydrolase activator NlpD